jgi:hypothetical protein
MRSIVVSAVLLATLAAAAGFGCSAEDPGGPVSFTPRRGQGSGGGGKDAGTTPAVDGGGGGGADSGGVRDAAPDTATQTLTAFTGAPGYASNPPATRANAVAAHNGPVAGLDCLTCHNGQATAPNFVFAGTVYKALNGGLPAADVQVRVVNPQGQQVGTIVNTDQDGNFWYEALNTTVPANSLVGARDAQDVMLMSTRITSGACNSANCHVGNMRVYVP